MTRKESLKQAISELENVIMQLPEMPPKNCGSFYLPPAKWNFCNKGEITKTKMRLAIEKLKAIREETPYISWDREGTIDAFDNYIRRYHCLPLASEINNDVSMPSSLIIKRIFKTTPKFFYLNQYDGIAEPRCYYTDLHNSFFKNMEPVADYLNGIATKAESLEIALLFIENNEVSCILKDILDEYISSKSSVTEWNRKRIDDCIKEFCLAHKRIPESKDYTNKAYRSGKGVFAESTQVYLKLPSVPTIYDYFFLNIKQFNEYYCKYGTLPNIKYAITLKGLGTTSAKEEIKEKFLKWYFYYKPRSVIQYKRHKPNYLPTYEALAAIFDLPMRCQWSDFVKAMDLPLYTEQPKRTQRKSKTITHISKVTEFIGEVTIEEFIADLHNDELQKEITKQLNDLEKRVDEDFKKFGADIKPNLNNPNKRLIFAE